MKSKYINLKIWIIPIVGLIIAAISVSFLPDQIPLHWGMNGEVNQMGSRYFVFLIPVISMAVLLFANIVPVIDPQKESYGKFGREYNLIHMLVLLFLLIMEIYVILSSLGVQLSMPVFVSLGLGALLTAVGNYLPKIPQNYLSGIKTVWGYSSEEAWNKIHRLAGKLWFFCGLLLIASAFIPAGISPYLHLAILAVIVLTPRIYGMAIARKYRKQ
jgi:uncharacterized membrane protein